MNKFLIFIIVITIKCYSQKPSETIQKGDTLIEIRTYENLNIINEFKKIANAKSNSAVELLQQ